MFRTGLVLAFGLGVAQTVAFAADYSLPSQSSSVVGANPFLGGYGALGGAYGINAQRSGSITSNGPVNGFSVSPSISGSPRRLVWHCGGRL